MTHSRKIITFFSLLFLFACTPEGNLDSLSDYLIPELKEGETICREFSEVIDSSNKMYLVISRLEDEGEKKVFQYEIFNYAWLLMQKTKEVISDGILEIQEIYIYLPDDVGKLFPVKFQPVNRTPIVLNDKQSLRIQMNLEGKTIFNEQLTFQMSVNREYVIKEQEINDETQIALVVNSKERMRSFLGDKPSDKINSIQSEMIYLRGLGIISVYSVNNENEAIQFGFSKDYTEAEFEQLKAENHTEVGS